MCVCLLVCACVCVCNKDVQLSGAYPGIDREGCKF